jgi:hypothetical protein
MIHLLPVVVAHQALVVTPAVAVIPVVVLNQSVTKLAGGMPPAPPSFIFFLSPERKPKQKKECENVLSSEAGTQILQITRRTRSAQTASRISLLRLPEGNQRLNIDSKNLHSSKDLLVRNVFERSE